MDARLEAVAEELREVESLEELNALLRDEDYAQYAIQLKCVVEEVRGKFKPALVEVVDRKEVVSVEPPKVEHRPVEPILRATRRYQLLKTDVSWTTKPQVVAIMAIIGAHMKVGDTVDESTIIKMLELNKSVLVTRQPIMKVWNYYKGNSDDGLQAHGNLKRI